MTANPGTANETEPSCIWLVQGHYLPENARGWLPFEAPADSETVPEEILEAIRLTEHGHFLPREHFPTDNYPRKNDDEGAHRKRIPQIFSNGFIFVSKESANVLRHFDLGEGALYPVRLWHPDRVTPVPGEYFYLSQGNRKNAFLPEHSPNARKIYRDRDLWWPVPNPEDDQLVFSIASLDGPDVWWDDRIMSYFFISDRLAQALLQAGIARDWQLLRCPVVAKRGE